MEVIFGNINKYFMKHEQVIYNNPPSKSNSYRIITIKGHGSLAKTDALKKYEKDFYLQCGAYRNKKISGFFEVSGIRYHIYRTVDYIAADSGMAFHYLELLIRQF